MSRFPSKGGITISETAEDSNNQQKSNPNSIFSGLSSVQEIFSKQESIDEILSSKIKSDMVMSESAALGESISGKRIEVDSSIALDTDFIVNVSKKISSLDSKLARVTKPESIRSKLDAERGLFFFEISELMNQIEEIANKFEFIESIELRESDRDLLVQHHASMLESVRLDREISQLSKNLEILRREVA